jgi:hypothetical protein
MICENCRGISLLNTTYKIFLIIPFQRLQSFVETDIGNYSVGLGLESPLQTIRIQSDKYCKR